MICHEMNIKEKWFQSHKHLSQKKIVNVSPNASKKDKNNPKLFLRRQKIILYFIFILIFKKFT